MKKWILYFIAINISIHSILLAVKFPDADVFKDSTDESLRSIYQSKLSNKTQCQWVKNLYGDKPHSSSCSYMREIPVTKIHPKGPQREPRTVCNTINDGCPGGYHKCNSEQCLKYYDGQPTPIYLLTDDSPCCADSETTHQWTIASDIDKARCMQSSRGVTNNGAYKDQWSWYAGSCYTRQEQYRYKKCSSYQTRQVPHTNYNMVEPPSQCKDVPSIDAVNTYNSKLDSYNTACKKSKSSYPTISQYNANNCDSVTSKIDTAVCQYCSSQDSLAITQAQKDAYQKRMTTLQKTKVDVNEKTNAIMGKLVVDSTTLNKCRTRLSNAQYLAIDSINECCSKLASGNIMLNDIIKVCGG